MKQKLSFLLLLIISLNFQSQNNFTASGDLFGRRVFIENNGQFDSIIKVGKKN